MSFPASVRDTLAPWARRGAAWRQRATSWYEQRPRREQRLLAAAAAVIVAALVFLVLVEPAWSTLQRARQELPELRAQAATVADLTAQVRALRRQGGDTPTAATPSATDLAASLRREGLPEESWSLAETARPSEGNAAPMPALTLTLREASAAALFRWLDTAARDWRLVVVDAEFTRATQPSGRRLPGRLNGSLTLLPATES